MLLLILVNGFYWPYFYLIQNLHKWMRRKPPKYFLAMMDFIFGAPPEMDYLCIVPLIRVGHDRGIPARFVDDIVEAGGKVDTEQWALSE